MQQWRYLAPVDGPGAYHMAVDAALVESIRSGRSGPVLRFYRWTPPCVTLGKFQPSEGNVNSEQCARLGIDVAKRPTGGRAILHDHEVTFSTLIPEADLPAAGSSIMDSYRVLGAALVEGLCRLGLPAALVDRQAQTRSADPGMMTASGNPACFAAKARCDIMIDHRKIIGCAQLRKHGVILQQNSLPLSVNYPLWDEVFFRSDWQSVASSGAVDLWTAAKRQIPYDEVVQALCYGFQSALHLELALDQLTGAEAAYAQDLQQQYAVLSCETVAEQVS